MSFALVLPLAIPVLQDKGFCTITLTDSTNARLWRYSEAQINAIALRIYEAFRPYHPTPSKSDRAWVSWSSKSKAWLLSMEANANTTDTLNQHMNAAAQTVNYSVLTELKIIPLCKHITAPLVYEKRTLHAYLSLCCSQCFSTFWLTFAYWQFAIAQDQKPKKIK